MKLTHLIPLLSVFVLGACATDAKNAKNAKNAPSALESRLKALEDQNAILYTMYTYAHALDYNLEDEWTDIWTKDATRADEVGRDAIVEMFRHHPHAPNIYWKHMMVEPRIHLDGDRATAESYLTRFMNGPNGPVVASFGRYRDILVRGTDGKWRFKERKIDRESCVKECGGFPGQTGTPYDRTYDPDAYLPMYDKEKLGK
jgi:hypothetical protein